LEKAQTSTRPKRLVRHTPRRVVYTRDELVRVRDLPGGIKRFKLKGNKSDG